MLWVQKFETLSRMSRARLSIKDFALLKPHIEQALSQPGDVTLLGQLPMGFLRWIGMHHPSSLQSLILIDPTIPIPNPGKDFVPASTYRRDLWPSRKFAAESFAKSKFYHAWDPRVLDLWVKYGLRDVPAEQGVDEGGEQPVTLQTTVAQEV